MTGEIFSLSQTVSIPIVGAVALWVLFAGIAGLILVFLLQKWLSKKKTGVTAGQSPLARHVRQPTGPEQNETPTALGQNPLAVPAANPLPASLASQAFATTPKRQRNQPPSNELDVLAADIADQSEREEKTEKELEELRHRLDAGSSVQEKGLAAAPQPVSPPAEHRHGRWRDKKPEATPQASAPAPAPPASERVHGRRAHGAMPASRAPGAVLPPSESQAELDALKKMNFKDLLKENKKEKEPQGTEDELKELQGSENEELSETEGENSGKCPNCGTETEEVFFCPECGTGFCAHCAKAFKKEGNQEYYQCPSCEAYVKKA